MIQSRQLSLFDGANSSALPLGDEVVSAIKSLAENRKEKSHGSIYTRSEVVHFILDLLDYKASEPLGSKRILEPAFGGGDFLFPIIERLIDSLHLDGQGLNYESIANCIFGIELHRETFTKTSRKVTGYLVERGFDENTARMLTDAWLRQGDFLLEPLESNFDYIIGNPPYVRQELIPEPLLSEYKLRYTTLFDRADLYIPFMERSLNLLHSTGTLGFICSDRWMKNRYGGPLRSLVSKEFHLAVYVDMVGTNAFTEEVTAYPAITVFNRNSGEKTCIVHRPPISSPSLSEIATAIATNNPGSAPGLFRKTTIQHSGTEPWILEASERIALLRRLEKDNPTIEDVGCRIGIGVATGADRHYIAPYESLAVEPDRKLPLATTKDISSGQVKWLGLGVINPFEDDGSLVDLEKYPLLRSYLAARKDAIAGRHCAKKSPDRWYRTIDRIWPDLAKQPKLLIPDIKGEAHIVYERGELYPHHNLYFVTSTEWNLHALQAVLLSSITNLFIAAYSTQMRGGYLRFQAQYLRRLRLPNWRSVDDDLRRKLTEAGFTRKLADCNNAVFKLYQLSHEERAILEENGE